MKRLLNFEYACIQGTYWMVYAPIVSFASVFLLAREYSNSEIGIILAAANVLAVVLQPLAGDIADRSKKISIFGITEIITVMMMLMTAGFFLIYGKSMVLSVIFVLLVAFHTILQPLFNSMPFKMAEGGVDVNFGLTRSLGSLAYAAIVALLGTLVESRGTGTLPVTAEIVMVMLLACLFITSAHFNKVKVHGNYIEKRSSVGDKDEKTEAENINLVQFIRRNKAFFILNIGVLGLYFSNAVLNNYMMQIVSSVGGDSEDMGRILSLMAFLEIPTMVMFSKLNKRFSCAAMLKVAAVGFTAKIGLCWLADSVAMVFAAQFFQLISFALFLPAMVQFINEVISKGEAVKGQALFTTMITAATVISSMIGGVILDISGAKMLTLVSTLVTAAGAAVIILTADKVKQR